MSNTDWELSAPPRLLTGVTPIGGVLGVIRFSVLQERETMMSDVNVNLLDGGEKAFSESTIQELRESLRGRIALPETPDYDEARTVWNAMIDRRPGLVIRCADAVDVVQSVRLARDNGLMVA